MDLCQPRPCEDRKTGLEFSPQRDVCLLRGVERRVLDDLRRSGFDELLGLPVNKRMSKTMASEIAARTLAVVNPQNRSIALTAALKRHGFTVGATAPLETLLDKSQLVAWLLSTYAPRP